MRHLAHSGRIPTSWLLAAVAINLCGATVRGDAPKTAAPAATRICVDLVGGGRVVGEPVRGDLRVEGESGSLTLPWAKVQRVVPGLERQPARLKRVLADIEQLSDAAFDNRERAQRELLAEGSRLRLILEGIKNDGDLERRTRVRALLKAIGSGEAAGPARLRQDVVVAGDQRRVGKIAASFVEVKTAAGVLRVPLDVVESIAPPLDTSPIDLLAKIDLKRDVVFGDWKRDGGTLVSPLQSRARLQIPVVPPANYDLQMTAVAKAARKAHAPADSLFIAVIVAGHQCNVALNSFADVAGGPFSGLDLLDGKRSHQVPLHNGAVLALDKEARIAVCVRGPKVEVAVDDTQLFQWDGDPARLSLCNQWGLNDSRYLGVGAHRTAYHISRFELLPIDAPKQPELAPGEAALRLKDGTLMPVKIDAEQAIVLRSGGAATKVPCDSLQSIRPASGRNGFRILLTTGETILVEKLPTQVIHLTTRFGPLAPSLDAIATLQRAK